MLVQLHDLLFLKVSYAFRGVCRQVDSRVVLDEVSDSVEGLTCCGQVLKNYGELVSMECCVNVRNIPVHHVIYAVSFSDDYAVAVGVSASLDEINAVNDFLRLREVVICTVRVCCADDVIACELESVSVFWADVDFCVWEALKFAGVVCVFVGNKNFADLFGFVAESLESRDVVIDFGVAFERDIRGESSINKNDFTACVDEEILKAAGV